MFWSEIGLGFEEPGAHPYREFRGVLPPHPPPPGERPSLNKQLQHIAGFHCRAIKIKIEKYSMNEVKKFTRYQEPIWAPDPAIDIVM